MPFRRLLILATVACASLGFGKSASTPRFTRKELSVGYREHSVIAMPKPERRRQIAEFEASAGIRVHHTMERLGGLRVIDLAANEDVDQAVARLKATDQYAFVEPDYVYRPDAIPNDPSFSTQWALDNTQQDPSYTFGADTRAFVAWDTIHDAPDVVVAVIDSGVRADHQDIAPNLWTNPHPTFGDVHGASFINGVQSGDITDEDGHGTHVAGILCAAGNNGVAIAGVVWKTQLMVLERFK